MKCEIGMKIPCRHFEAVVRDGLHKKPKKGRQSTDFCIKLIMPPHIHHIRNQSDIQNRHSHTHIYDSKSIFNLSSWIFTAHIHGNKSVAQFYQKKKKILFAIELNWLQ